MRRVSNDTRVIFATGAIFGGAALLLVGVGLLPEALASGSRAATVQVAQSVDDVVDGVQRMLRAPVDTDALLKWDFTADPGVSTTPQRESRIVKLGYGKRTVVDVVQTSSGVYSSDALADPHIFYPGIHREPKLNSAEALISMLTELGKWVSFRPVAAGSFVTLTPFESGQLLVTEDAACIYTDTETNC